MNRHEAQTSARSQRTRKAHQTPDLLPEFFECENFATEGLVGEDVRCVCGVVIDDSQHMIACETCGVWQHTACMGDAVPDDEETGFYCCHVCDPWAHRKLIAGLRRSNPLTG